MSWKKILLIALVVLLLMVGVPLPGVMGGMSCPLSGSATPCGFGFALAVVAGLALVGAWMSERLRPLDDDCRQLLRPLLLYRPPRVT